MALTPRDSYLRRTYSITEADFNRIFESQARACAICRKPPAAGKNLHVDHNHRTGQVRGLLCHMCNYDLIGRRVDAGIFRAAAEYLESPPASAVLDAGHTVPTRPKRRRRKKAAA